MWLAFLTLKNDHWKVTKNDCSWHYMFCGQILRLDRQIPCKKMAHISNYIHNCTVVAVTGNGSSLVQINLLLNIISFYSTEELLRHTSVCFFCSTVLPNPFWGAVPWHWEVLAFCCPKFPLSLCDQQLLKTAHQFMQVISRAIQNEVPVRIPMQQTVPKEKHNFSSGGLCKSLPGQNSAGVKN